MSKMTEKTPSRSHSKRLFLFLGLITLLLLMTNFASSAFPTTGVEAYYRLDEISGTTVNDATGSYDGTSSGVTINQDGVIGKSYLFGTTVNNNKYVNTSFIPSGTSFSIGGWIYSTSLTTNANRYIYSNIDGNYGSYLIINSYPGGAGDPPIYFQFNKGTGTASQYVRADYDLTGHENEWIHVIATWDGTNAKIYVNGTDVGISSTTFTTEAINWGTEDLVIGNRKAYDRGFEGKLDEIGIWNVSLSQSQVTELYNKEPYPDASTIEFLINLTSPANATTISDLGTNFTAQLNMSGTNYDYIWRNMTYYVWKNGIEANSTFINLVSLEKNNTDYTQFIDDFTFGDYEWNVYACYGNGTYRNCTWSEDNYTFDVVPFEVLDENYNNITLEGSTNTFDINISVISGERLSTLKFIYNGVEYSGGFTEYDTNEYYATYALKTPKLTSTIENYTFYWIAELESGYKQNSTAHNQTVVKIYLDDCSTYSYQILNFTVHDEITKLKLDGETDNVTVKINFELSYLDNSAQIIQFSNEYLNTNPARVCMQNQTYNSSLRMDAIVEYSSIGRFIEFYNIQNFVFNSTTSARNISLYDLNSSVGQEFKITYRGIDYIPVADLIIQIQRKYIEDGQFRTVEIPMSGSNGYTIAHLVSNDVIYNLIFIKEGIVLDSFLNVVATCQNPTFTECEINLNSEVSGEDLFDLIQRDNFFSSLSFDRSTRIISATFGLFDGTSGTTTLKVYLADNIGNTEVCSDSLSASGGTLSCVVPTSIGNSTVYAVVLFDGEIQREGFINLQIEPKQLWGDSLIFGILIIFLFLVGMGLTISGSDGITYGLFLIIGMILLTAVNLFYTKSWIGTGASILWLLIAIIMVMIKSGSKR